MSEIAELAFRAETGELVKARDLLKTLKKPAEEAETASGKLEARINQLGDSMNPLNSRIGRLVSAFGALAAAMAAAMGLRAYAKLADTWSDISARAGLAVGNMDLAGETMKRLSSMARTTYSSLQNTAEGFIANAQSLRELGYSSKETLDYIEAVNNALVISGARGERAESVQRALSKAMATGKLDGDGLQTVLANGGRVAQALAKALGTTTNGLRAMAAEGRITGKVIYNALTGEFETLRDEAAEMPATIEDAFTIINNAVLTAVGTFDKLFGISEWVATQLIVVGDGIQYLAENMEPFFAQVGRGVEFLRALGERFSALVVEGMAPVIESAQRLGGHINTLWNYISALIPTTREAAITLAILFGPVALAGVGSMILGVANLTVAIGTGLVNAIRAASSAMIALALRNPFTAILLGVGVAMAAIYTFRDAIATALGVDVIDVAKTAANGIIGAFVGAFNAIKGTWSQLPAGIGAIVIRAANAVISTVNNMIKSNVDAINRLFSQLPFGLGDGLSINVGAIPELANKFAEEAKSAGEIVRSSFREAFATDWVGDFGVALSEVSDKLDIGTIAAGDMASAITDLGDVAAGGGAAGADDAAGGKGGKGKGSAKDKLTELQKIAEDFSKLSAPFDQAKTAFEAAKTAMENGIITNDQYASSLLRIEEAFMRAGGSAAQWAKITADSTNEVGAKLKEITEGALTGLGDQIMTLGSEGSGNFKEFAASVIKDLARMAWQAMVVKPLLGALGFGGGAAAGAGGGIGGFLGKLLPFAKGGAFTNSIVDQPTMFAFANGGAFGVMGEAGPEAIMPLTRGADGSLGVQMFGNGGSQSGGDSITFAPTITIDAKNADAAQVAKMVRDELEEFDKRLERDWGRRSQNSRMMSRRGTF